MLLHVYYFEHLNLPDGGTSMRLLIWVLYAGIVIGSLLGTLDKVYCGAFVHALRQGGCVAAESAATLAEMDTRGKWYLRLALRPGKPLWKMIAVTEGEAGKARFYLPEEKRDLAELRYQNGNRPIRTLVLAIVLLTGVAGTDRSAGAFDHARQSLRHALRNRSGCNRTGAAFPTTITHRI